MCRAWGSRGVLVIWTAPANPAGAPVIGYKVEVSKDDSATFETLTDNLNTGETHFVDEEELPMDESACLPRNVHQLRRRGNRNDYGHDPAGGAHHAPAGRPAATDLGEPAITSVTGGTGSVTVAWTDGDNAASHMVLLLNTDFSLVAGSVKANATSPETISVASGSYIVIVLSLDADSEFEYDFDTVTVN